MDLGQVVAREFRFALAELRRVADYAAEAERIFRELRSAGHGSDGEKAPVDREGTGVRGQSTGAAVRDPAG